MKTTRNTVDTKGIRTVTVKLAPGERVMILNDGIVVPMEQGSTLKVIHNHYNYRLGGQVEDIMAPHVITEANPVYWCSIEQKWVDA